MAKTITMVRGDDTNWRGIDFITVNINAPMLDLSTFKAVFVLANITKNFNDISSGSFILNFSAQETANLPTTCYGALRLIDSSNRIATLETVIPFNVISQVHGNAISTEPYTITFDVTQGSEYILDFEVKVGGGGSGAVDSVNGKTGVVVLNASDVGAQETLISGTNIKTINNQSILGSGNIDIQGGGGGSSYEIGEIIASTVPLSNAGLHPLDGTLLSGSGSYSDFVDYMADLYNDDPTSDYFSKARTVYNVTLVGNLTNNNGVLSGFSANTNYATFPVFKPENNTWVQYWKVTTGSSLSGIHCFVGNGHVDYAKPVLGVKNSAWVVYLSSNGTSWNIASEITGGSVSPNTTYYLRFAWTGTTYDLDYSTDGITYNYVMSLSGTSPIYDNNSPNRIGETNGSKAWNGTVDLNECYIEINNEKTWEGKTILNPEEAWQDDVARYGACGQYVYNSEENTLRLPKYGNELKTVSDLASNVYYYVVVATTTKTDIQVDIDEIATDLNGKADVDLSNINNVSPSARVFISEMGIPSTVFDDLIIGSSGTEYTAPSNGWFFLSGNGMTSSTTGTSAYVGLYNTTKNVGMFTNSIPPALAQFAQATQLITLMVPASKGDKATLTYSTFTIASGSILRFIYAEGSKSEK